MNIYRSDDVVGYGAHRGPGRRFAAGTTRGDQALGAFGFLAHAVLFAGVGAWCVHEWPASGLPLSRACLVIAAAALVVRAVQVGATTTKESLVAIRDAWF